MTLKIEHTHDAEFLVSEANGYRSRDQIVVTVAAGAVARPGLILGKITASGKYVARDEAQMTGEQTAAGILFNECNNTDGVAPVDFKATVVNSDAEVLGPSCDASGGTEATVLSELADLGIKVRGDLSNVAT